jgi:hypothetical protein
MTKTKLASKRMIFPAEIKAVSPGEMVCLEFRLNIERRQFLYTYHLPERRSGRDRRGG